MQKRINMLLKTIIILILLTACHGEKMEDKKVLDNAFKKVSASAWEKLSNKKIFFGHQSVGYNILDGIKELMLEYTEIKLNVVETSDKTDFKAGVFAHSKVGSNCDPKSKIDGFKKLIDEGLGENTDIAFLKFCYIDFNPNTNIKKVFAEYSDTISKLKKEYPAITFIHVTAPLVKIQTGPKAWVKKLIGRSLDGISDNVARCSFNELLRKEYEGTDQVFDLAKIESTYPDGKRESFSKEGKIFYAMVPAYTDDGGHLNEKGRARTAAQLLVLLANTE